MKFLIFISVGRGQVKIGQIHPNWDNLVFYRISVHEFVYCYCLALDLLEGALADRFYFVDVDLHRFKGDVNLMELDFSDYAIIQVKNRFGKLKVNM